MKIKSIVDFPQYLKSARSATTYNDFLRLSAPVYTKFRNTLKDKHLGVWEKLLKIAKAEHEKEFNPDLDY